MGFHIKGCSVLWGSTVRVVLRYGEGCYVMGFHSEGGPTLWGSTVRVVLCYGVPQCGGYIPLWGGFHVLPHCGVPH